MAAGNLWILDVSKLSDPVLTAKLDVPLTSVDSELADTLLFLIEQTFSWPPGYSSLTTISITDPDSPKVLNRHLMPGMFSNLEVDSQYAYISADASGMVTLNVTDPLAPVTAACFSASGTTSHLVKRDNKMFVANDIALLADDLFPFNYCSEQGQTFQNPNNINNSGDFQILNISDVQAASVVGTYFNPGLVNLVALSENNLFVASSDGSIKLIDLKNPDDFSVKSSVEVGEVSDMATSGNTLLSVVKDELTVISILDKKEMEIKGKLTLPTGASGVGTNGHLAVVCMGSLGIGIVDISDAEPPELLGGLSTPDFAIDALIDGNFAYIADRNSGLQVVDISNPSLPVIVSSFPEPGLSDWVISLALDDNIIYA